MLNCYCAQALLTETNVGQRPLIASKGHGVSSGGAYQRSMYVRITRSISTPKARRRCPKRKWLLLYTS